MSPTGWGHLSLSGIVQSASLLLLARGPGITRPRILNTWPPGSNETLAFRGADPRMGKPSHPKNRESGNQVGGSGKLDIS
jgi:hypothetical protein